MYIEGLLDKIKASCIPFIKELGYELIDVKMGRSSGRLVVSFLVDHASGGISISECADINDKLSALFNRENILGDSYVIDVSSPGVDRALVERRDFLRARGRRVMVFLKEKTEGKTEVEGIVNSVDECCLFLDVRGNIEKINFDNIFKAKQVIE